MKNDDHLSAFNSWHWLDIPTDKALLSEKDTKHALLKDFDSPFSIDMDLYPELLSMDWLEDKRPISIYRLMIID